MKLSVDIEINSLKEQVWAAITNISNSDNMIEAILSIDVLNQPEQGVVGLKWKETRKVFGKESTETMWITEAKDNEFYKTRAENCGAIYVTTLSLEEVDGKTKLTMTFAGTSDSMFVKIMSSIMSIFIKKSMIKMLNKDLEDIKSFVEKN